ncbi:MAG: deoxynucleoside kinase [Deltaproteobacteria bacterium]|nr:deoxynucleoside kinase [Deltaproteobacteria bacterium]
MTGQKKVVIVEGIIGAGKSSLTKELGAALGPQTLVEMEPDEANNANPYLADFYHDPKRWALVMQVHLLQARYRMHLQAQWHAMSGAGHAVLDRSYFGDTCFARLQLRNGSMTLREFNTYRDLYHTMTAHVLLPNVCVRLLVSPEVSRRRIESRMEQREGRKCEAGIDLQYLIDLDREISHMVAVLRSQGVTVIDMPWDVDRESAEQRRLAVDSLACRIAEQDAPDSFLDLHRRTL